MNVQLANTYNPSKNYGVSSWYASPKLDGVRAVFIPEQGFFTRNGKSISGLDSMTGVLDEECKSRGLSFIDGELIISGRSFQASQGVILSAEHCDKSKIEFHVFAVGGSFTDTASMLSAIPDRPEAKIFRVNSEVIPNTFESVEAACRKFMDSGYEGVMLRNTNTAYFEGRSDSLLKYKFFNEADLEIVEINNARSVTVRGKVNGQYIKCKVRFSGENLLGKFLSVKYQAITDSPDIDGFYSLRFPSAIGIKEDRDFVLQTKEVSPKAKFTSKTANGVTYYNNGFVEAVFQITFSQDKHSVRRPSYLPAKSTMSDWKKRLYKCRSIQEGRDLIAELKLTIPQLREFAKYLGVKLSGCKYLKAEIVRWLLNASLGAKLRASRILALVWALRIKKIIRKGMRTTQMNKQELLTRIRNLRRELDGLEDIVIALEESQPVQIPQTQDSDMWLTVKQVCKYLNISQSTFYEAIKNGILPPGFAFGAKTKRWRVSDIRAWQLSSQEKYGSESQANKRGRVSRIRKVSEFCHA